MEENMDINNHTERRGNDVEMMRRWCEKVRSVPKVSEALLECKTSACWRKRRSVGENVGARGKTSERRERHRRGIGACRSDRRGVRSDHMFVTVRDSTPSLTAEPRGQRDRKRRAKWKQ